MLAVDADHEDNRRHAVELAGLSEARHTKGRFNKLVEALKRPSAVFFLPEPPPRQARHRSRRAVTSASRGSSSHSPGNR